MSTKLTGNIYIDNLIWNMVPFLPFLIGIYMPSEGFTDLGLAIYWFTAVGGTLMMFVPEQAWDAVVEKAYKPEGNQELLNKSWNQKYRQFNVTYDLIIVTMLAYFDFGVLAAVYATHIIGYMQSFAGMRKADTRYQEAAVKRKKFEDEMDAKEAEDRAAREAAGAPGPE